MMTPIASIAYPARPQCGEYSIQPRGRANAQREPAGHAYTAMFSPPAAGEKAASVR
jgi:hypothetical protein